MEWLLQIGAVHGHKGGGWMRTVTEMKGYSGQRRILDCRKEYRAVEEKVMAKVGSQYGTEQDYLSVDDLFPGNPSPVSLGSLNSAQMASSILCFDLL